MNRTDRLLALVLELQAKPPRRAEDLAHTFETSKRTIYRDIQALCEAGVPVISSPGGFSLDEGYFLPPLAFTVDEATLVLLGVDAIASSFDAEYRAAAESAARKVQTALPAAVRDRSAWLRDSLLFANSATPSSPAEIETLRLLRRAILRQTTIRFRYFTRFPGAGRVSLRDADPYSLVCVGGVWLMSAYCHTRKEQRFFRLSRMEDVTLTGRTFERPAGYRVNDERHRPNSRVVTVQLLFDDDSAPWVMEDRYFYIDRREETDDGLRVTLRLHHLDEAVQWILGWGRHVRVLEPEPLRERIWSEARALWENHAEPEPV